MADYLTTDADLTAVADAIREKGGTSAALEWPQGYVDAIGAISGGGGPVLNPLDGAYIRDIASGGTWTHQYEFNPEWGEPDFIGLFEDMGSQAAEGTALSRGYVYVPTCTTTQEYGFSNLYITFDKTGLLTATNYNSSSDSTRFAGVVMTWLKPSTDIDCMIVDAFALPYLDDPCYLRGTLITLADGSKKPVEEITYDDDLLVWDFDEGMLSSAKPLWIKRPQKKVGYHHLTLESGKTLDVVGTNGKAHRLLDIDAEKFVWSTDMVGHRTMTIDGKDRLISCEWREEPCEYYNIVTKRHINLYANDILTSCRYNNIYPIREMRFAKEARETIPFEAYDVPREWYEGMRLGEQTIPIEDTNAYIDRLRYLSI